MISVSNETATVSHLSSAEATFWEVNGVTLHVVEAGNPEDPLVVLLHGFPECWYGWSEYVEPFVDAGYRVLVPDQRGYNRSDKPEGVRSYRLQSLSKDIVSLIGSEGCTNAHLIGHDWGAAVAWDVALRHPEAVDRLGILNVPHPSVFRRTILRSPTQLRKSWYMFYFQLPRLPEWVLKRLAFEPLVDVMRDGANPGTFDDERLRRYREAWSRPGALTAMLNWYRAVRHYEAPPRESVRAPTRIVWGEHDDALVPEMASASLRYCETGDRHQYADATHWLTHEHPDRVSEALLEHLES
ncbi:MAG: pimeloyl-ACP methyl ester carboxylesterase [Natronomonas sp.]|mgnify:CR=1 FL=1|uniref:alpha/beta fold hydrolase n=1 Tax=Natronomonas sp. TaxID=2184060 RepID=UPI003988FE39